LKTTLAHNNFSSEEGPVFLLEGRVYYNPFSPVDGETLFPKKRNSKMILQKTLLSFIEKNINYNITL